LINSARQGKPAFDWRRTIPPKPTILTLHEFLGLKGEQSQSTLVYFNEPQWGNLTRNLRPRKGKVPAASPMITLTTFPGMEGGFGMIRCPFVEPITGAEGQARCAPKLETFGPLEPLEPAADRCELIFHDDGKVECSGKCSQRTEKCQPGSVIISTAAGEVSAVICNCSPRRP
jgi:hypothetical protein